MTAKNKQKQKISLVDLKRVPRRTKCGVLRCAQDDRVKQTKAKDDRVKHAIAKDDGVEDTISART
jgi:hypothetical protein